MRQAQGGLETALRRFRTQDFRDLQVFSQLAWFDEEFRATDPEVRELFAKGRDFTLDDQALMGRKQREIIGQGDPGYSRMAQAGQIEISTTPYYHPILPLLCDSNIAAVSHPDVPLPPRFRYPEDARAQLQMARDYMQRQFGVAPVGLWPSEGSVSDEVFDLPPMSASAGPPPTAACSSARWAARSAWRPSTGRTAGSTTAASSA